MGRNLVFSVTYWLCFLQNCVSDALVLDLQSRFSPRARNLTKLMKNLVTLSETTRPFSPAAEFVHFGLTAKHQLTTALARLRVRGIPHAGWARDSLSLCEENNLSPLASPYPLPSERAVITCGPCIRLAENVNRFPLNTQIASRITGIHDGIRIQIWEKGDRFPL